MKLQFSLILLNFYIRGYVFILTYLAMKTDSNWATRQYSALINFINMINLKQFNNILNSNNRLLDFIFANVIIDMQI